jgi:hypothetical protein
VANRGRGPAPLHSLLHIADQVPPKWMGAAEERERRARYRATADARREREGRERARCTRVIRPPSSSQPAEGARFRDPVPSRVARPSARVPGVQRGGFSVSMTCGPRHKPTSLKVEIQRDFDDGSFILSLLSASFWSYTLVARRSLLKTRFGSWTSDGDTRGCRDLLGGVVSRDTVRSAT